MNIEITNDKWIVTQENNLFQKGAELINENLYRGVRWTIEYNYVLRSSFSAFDPLLAPGKAMNGISLVTSPSAVKLKLFFFSWPVVFNRIVLSPVLSTVVLDTISCYTAVSSIAMISLSW